jgi:CRP-like cAMP-binding protein
MPERFKKHLEKFIDINDSEFLDILAFFKVLKVRKKENLLVEGQLCKSHYFVLNGCLRKFFVNEKGIEQTTEFAIENWWITDNIAFENKLASEFYIQAVENSEILIIDQHSQEKLLAEFPKMERYFRFIYQRAYAASQMRIKYLYSFSKEDFYHQFSSKHPEFVQRIPQYLIASFLGFTPEYLSEIRNKKRS